MIEESSS